MEIANIKRIKWRMETGGREKWYNTEVYLKSCTKGANPMQGFPSNCVILNDQWFFEDKVYGVREREIKKSLKEDKIEFLSRLVGQSEEYIHEVETTLRRVKRVSSIDSLLLAKIKERFTLLWYIFLIDLGKYLGPSIETILENKHLSIDQIEEIENHYLAAQQSLEYQKEKEDLRRIASIYTSRYGHRNIPIQKLPPDIRKLLDLHCTRFRWLTNNELDSQPFMVEDYYRELKQLVISPSHTRIKNSAPLNKKITKLLTEEDKKFLKLVSRHTFLDNYAGELYAKLDFLLQNLLSRQFSVSFQDLTWYTFEELETLANNWTKLSKTQLEERKMYRVMIQMDGEIKCLYGRKDFEKIRSLLRATWNLGKISEIRGISASRGIARGTVKVVRAVQDMKKVHTGDILVAPTTRVELMTAILKCSAIITDTGGITSHAAIVSRELKIPCIVGTDIATRVLKDGNLVQVNGTEGIIKILQ